MKLSRVYFECLPCHQYGYVADDRLGVDGRYSHQAQRLICLAGSSWSYDVSSERLADFCGLRVSDTTIREISQQHGAEANEWLRTEPEAVRPFREADGEIEFTTDGTSVNTTDGWREMKVGLFSKRERGESATPEQWADRDLPRPAVTVPFAAIEASDRFGSRWKAWRKRLGLVDPTAITVLADGAKWIWEEQIKQMPGADGVLDVFHALEHVHQAGRELHEEDDEAMAAWCEAAREALLGSGGHEQIGRLLEADAGHPAVAALQNYLWPHQHHLNYAERLAEGRSIGSGQVEGACKNLIGRRLKQTGARWRVRRVNRMAGLCSLMHSRQWAAYWQTT